MNGGVLTSGIRSELLRYVSGYSILGIVAFSALVPWFVANFLGWPDSSGALSVSDNIRIFWSLAASIAPVATFAGSYLVTREAYYGTLRRTVVTAGMTNVLLSKYVAAVVVGIGSVATGILVWGGTIAFSLPPDVASQLVAPESLGLLPGVLVASALAAVWGCSLGWIFQHYYATTILTLVIPLAVELPLLANAPDMARWLPSGALAGIASVPFQGLLEPSAAFFVSVGWLLFAGFGAVWSLRRKEL
ncbi:ABC-2 type transport system permease protein [Paenarthrobacter sp. 4246]